MNNLEKKCLHEVVTFLGTQEIPKDLIPDYEPIPMGNCNSCNNTIVISDNYQQTSDGVYILNRSANKPI